jgi:hypothetical protein
MNVRVRVEHALRKKKRREPRSGLAPKTFVTTDICPSDPAENQQDYNNEKDKP